MCPDRLRNYIIAVRAKMYEFDMTAEEVLTKYFTSLSIKGKKEILEEMKKGGD